jgi:hypothetical protein
MRVQHLVEEPALWQAFQLILAFADTACAKVVHEIPEALKASSSAEANDRKTLVDDLFSELKTLDDESTKHHIYVENLQRIAMVLEPRKLSFKQLKKIRKVPDVISAIAAIKETYGDDIQSRTEE